MQILIAILALSFLIVIHELGHFTVAKLAGIKVHEFALFMGPKLFSVQRGETTYSIRAIPLGGYVRMEGEEEESEDERAFNKQPIWVRAAVIFAGPLMNIVAAVIFVVFLFSYQGFDTSQIAATEKNTPVHEALQPGDKIIEVNGTKIYSRFDYLLFSHSPKGDAVKMEVLREGKEVPETITLAPKKIPEKTHYLVGFNPREVEGTPTNIVEEVSNPSAKEAGLQAGDEIIMINGDEVKNRETITKIMDENKDKPISVVVRRNGKDVALEKEITPEVTKIPERYTVGIVNFEWKEGNFGEVVKESVGYTYSMARNVYYSIAFLIQGKFSFKDMMGPVGIVNTIGQVVESQPSLLDKIVGLLDITILISINLGMFNLIPFPALDGSKLLILGIEAVRRKALKPEKEALITMVGFVLLILLMIFTTSNDILRILSD